MKPNSKDSAAKIYVGNLPPRCTERDVEDLCKQFGSIDRADIVKNFAFVVGLPFFILYCCSYFCLKCLLGVTMSFIASVIAIRCPLMTTLVHKIASELLQSSSAFHFYMHTCSFFKKDVSYLLLPICLYHLFLRVV